MNRYLEHLEELTRKQAELRVIAKNADSNLRNARKRYYRDWVESQVGIGDFVLLKIQSRTNSFLLKFDGRTWYSPGGVGNVNWGYI